MTVAEQINPPFFRPAGTGKFACNVDEVTKAERGVGCGAEWW